MGKIGKIHLRRPNFRKITNSDKTSDNCFFLSRIFDPATLMYFGYFCFKKRGLNMFETPGSVFRLEGFAQVTQPLVCLHMLFSKL